MSSECEVHQPFGADGSALCPLIASSQLSGRTVGTSTHFHTEPGKSKHDLRSSQWWVRGWFIEWNGLFLTPQLGQERCTVLVTGTGVTNFMQLGSKLIYFLGSPVGNRTKFVPGKIFFKANVLRKRPNLSTISGAFLSISSSWSGYYHSLFGPFISHPYLFHL
jgi:hypothetical protein